MKRQNLKIIIGVLIVFLLVAGIIVFVTRDQKSTKRRIEEQSTTRLSTTTTKPLPPVPTFEETEVSSKIPNPCEVISIEHVDNIIKNANVRGPFFQDAVVPLKVCEWTMQGKEFPRLGVSIVSSNDFFDTTEEKKIMDVPVGDKAFLIENYTTGVGGSSCGQTLMVKLRNFSYSIAVCTKDNSAPSQELMTGLANDVANSLP